MGVYVSVRGWLECDDTQLATVQEIIASHADDHYSGGWSTPRQRVDRTRYRAGREAGVASARSSCTRPA
ncbi:hypothetical protein [Streptomyces sp. WG7]|uniref:hypothetical protein n=1 Tax=Streptomyces sp. WG7 TaxID=3417650 RepID=UPI003CF1EF8D